MHRLEIDGWVWQNIEKSFCANFFINRFNKKLELSFTEIKLKKREGWRLVCVIADCNLHKSFNI